MKALVVHNNAYLDLNDDSSLDPQFTLNVLYSMHHASVCANSFCNLSPLPTAAIITFSDND